MRRSLGHSSCDRVPFPAAAACSVALLLAASCPSALSQSSGSPRRFLVDTTATGVISGTAGPDEIIGTAGDDTINGRGGADVMIGYAGNDTYIVTNDDDQVVEQSREGIDTIRAFGNCVLPAHVEILVLAGKRASFGMGNRLANRVIGNIGYNTLDGGPGNDALTGGTGPDLFRFWSALDAATNVDRLTDFDASEDRIALHYTAFPTFLISDGLLQGRQFHVGSAATTASHRIVFDATSGALSYGPDGSGPIPAIRFATLPANLALTSNNFLIWSRYYR